MSLKKHKWNYHESLKENYCDICASGDQNIEAEIKKEGLEETEMPTFESEATYLDCNIKKEIKIEPCEIAQDDQMFENFTT